MPDELRINVGVGGAKEAEAALKGVAGAEHAIGAAAQTGAAGIAKTAAAKKGAGEAAHELRLRNASLLGQVKSLGPEFGIAADAINQFINKTTGAGMALGFLGVAIGAATYVYSKMSAVQAEEKQKAEAFLKNLQQQYVAYLDLAGAIEKAARAKGALGAGTGEAVGKRFLALAPEGVSRETAQEAGRLAAGLRREVTDEEAQAMMMRLHLGGEPRGKTDRAKAQALQRGEGLDALRQRMAAWASASPLTMAQRKAEIEEARAGLTPQAEAEGIIAAVARRESVRIGRERTPQAMRDELQYLSRVARGLEGGDFAVGERGEIADETERLRRQYPELERAAVVQITGPLTIYRGSVVYKGQDSDPAGQIPRNPAR